MNNQPQTNEAGFTLLFTVSVLGLLAALGLMLTGPTALEAARVDRYYRKLQARELSLAGLERARSLGTSTNLVYDLGNGTVTVNIHTEPGGRCRVVSTGRVTASGRKQSIAVQTEELILCR